MTNHNRFCFFGCWRPRAGLGRGVSGDPVAFSLSLPPSLSLCFCLSMYSLSSSPSSSSSTSVSLSLLFSVPQLPWPLTHGFQKHQRICGAQTSLVNHNLIIIVFVFLVVGGHGLVCGGACLEILVPSLSPSLFLPFCIHLVMVPLLSLSLLFSFFVFLFLPLPFSPMAFSLPLSLLIYISLCSSSSLLFLFRSGAG